MPLRQYQKDLLNKVREAFRHHKTVCMQLPTGGGKTHIFAEMTRLAYKNQNVWILVPRRELIKQASKKLTDISVPHGIIAPCHEESDHSVHVVSKDTLIRRYDKIKREPTFIIVDEAHLALDRYLEIRGRYPDAFFLGVTATPELLGNRGLSDLYEILVPGPSLGELVDIGYLSDAEFYCPPGPALDGVRRKGTEYDAKQLHEHMAVNEIYGKSVEHYQDIAPGRPSLVYCRSIDAASRVAEDFRQAGFDFLHIDGTMPVKKRDGLIKSLTDGEIHGLTSCEIVTYGIDIPIVDTIVMLRPTMSRSLFFQMIGRGLRISPGKSMCTVLDHAGNVRRHGHPFDFTDWQFDGKDKSTQKKEEKITSLMLCEECFLYYTGLVCPHCGNEREIKRGGYNEIDGKLVKITRKEYEQQAREAGTLGERVQNMIEVARMTDRKPVWIYHQLKREKVDVSVLNEMREQLGYKPGWVWFMKKQLGGMR